MNTHIQSYKNDWITIKTAISKEKSKIDSISNNESLNKLVDFLISAEDHRFHYHLGFDVIAIIRAIRNKVLFSKNEGASTIEQQLVRTITCDFERSYIRKTKEIVFAFSLKRLADKKTLALIYLNIAYYGTNFENLDKILLKFNLKKGDFLSHETCSEIVSRLKYPEPKLKINEKMNLIERRKKYLLKLHEKHSNYKLLRIHGKYQNVY
jgi:membrane carboxypeptidase/penicillin-binding protein PbpC